MRSRNRIIEDSLFIITLAGNFFLFHYIIQLITNLIGLENNYLLSLSFGMMALLPVVTTLFTFSFLKQDSPKWYERNERNDRDARS